MDEKVKEYLDKLRPMFDHMLSYVGDDELISSCNAEYNIDPEDFIVTDGMINMCMQTAVVYPDGATNPITAYKIVELSTAVRGATYLIICNVGNDHKYETDLRVDESTLNEDTYKRIVKSLDEIKNKFDEMDYYIKEWRCKALPQSVSINSLLEEAL